MKRFGVDIIFGLFVMCSLINSCLAVNAHPSEVVFLKTDCKLMSVPNAYSCRPTSSKIPYQSHQRSCSIDSTAGKKALFCCDSKACSASPIHYNALYRCGGENANIWYKKKGGFQCGGVSELTYF